MRRIWQAIRTAKRHVREHLACSEAGQIVAQAACPVLVVSS